MSDPKPTRLDQRDCMDARKYIQARVNITPSGCWEWRGHRLHFGHGQAKWSGYPVKAHRLSYAAFKEEPGTLGVLHECDNPPCCNPDHLFLGTKGENNRDAAAKGRYAMRPNRFTRKFTEVPVHKVTLEAFWTCLDLLVSGASYLVAAELTGLTKHTARRIGTDPAHWTHAKFGMGRSLSCLRFLDAMVSRRGPRTA